MKKILTAILVFSSMLAGAQTTNYNALSGPFGGEMLDMIQVGTTIIGTVSGQGIVISTNNGSTWTTSNTGINIYYIYDLERDPDTGKIYALSSYRLFSSVDNGATWVTEATNTFSDGYRMKKTSSYLFIVSRFSGRVYRSANATTWAQVNTIGSNPYTFDMDVNAAGNIFISTQGQGVFRSTDNGLTFTQLDAGEGLTDLNVYGFTINSTDLYALSSTGPFKSTNNGTTWTSVKNTAINLETFYDATINNFGSSIFIFNYSKAFVSTNGGTSWTAITHPQNGSPLYNYTASSLFISATEFYVSLRDYGTFRTTDGGATWSERNNGVTGFDYYQTDQILIAPTTNRILMTRPNATGLFVSIDDGVTWDFLNSAPFYERISGIKQIGANIYTYGPGGINRSTDNALNFSEIWNAQIGTCSYPVNVLTASSTTNFFSYSSWDCLASGNYLLKSTDGGVSWTKSAITGMPSPSTSYLFGDNYFFADASGTIYTLVYNYTAGTNRGELYKINSTTGAATYVSNIPNGSFQIIDLDFVNNKLYVTSSDGKIHKSIDGGTTWSTMTTGGGYGFTKVLSDNTIYFNSSQGTYISTDAGLNWVNTGSFGNGRAANDVVLSATNFAYVVVDNAVLHKSAATVIPPNPPSGLTITGTLNDFVSLRWTDNSTNEDYFIIERSKGNNTSYDSIGTSTRPNGAAQTFVSRIVSGLEPSTTYFFRVRAKGAAGKSAYTAEVSTTTEATCATPLSFPDNRSWKVTSNGTTSAPNVPIYVLTTGVFIGDLYLGTTSPLAGNLLSGSVRINCNSAVLSTASGFAVADGNGTWDPVAKKLTVKWRSGNTTSNPNTAISTSVYELNAVDPAPAVPTELSAYIKTANEIVVTWVSTDYAVSYTVERATAPGGPFTSVGTVNHPSTQIIDNFAFATGTTYYYRVSATSNGGTSAASANFAVPFVVPRFEALSLTGFDNSTQGISWIDLENDGDEDLLVAPFGVAGSSITAFENLGNGSFQKVGLNGVDGLLGITVRTISVGDINNDGLQDFISNSTGAAGGGDVFINKGSKTFERTNLVPGNTTGFNWYASITDLNDDGRPDVVFTDDVVSPSSTSYKMFTQNALGAFEPYELGAIVATSSVSRGGSWADIDNDGDLDFVRTSYGVTASDFDLVFTNSAGEFTKVPTSGLESDFALAPRSVSWGDIDNDLDLDLFIGHNGFNLNNMLYRNNGDGTFTRLNTSVVAEALVDQPFGSVFGDFDNDGDLDLVVGTTSKGLAYLNDGTGVFSKYEGAEYLVATDGNRTNIAFATADYDKNGTLDIATGKTVLAGSFPSIMLRNNLVIGANQKWLEVKLIGTTSGKTALGARVIITTPDTKKQMRQVLPLTGYGSSSSMIAHFGLKNQASATIEVRWPSGLVQTMAGVTANQLVTITEDSAGPVIMSRTPGVSETNVAANTTIVITLNEPTTAVTGKKLRLYRSTDLSTSILDIDVSAATKEADSYTFTLPSKLTGGAQYNVAVEAGAFRDLYANNSLEFAAAQWSFTVAPSPVVSAFSPAQNATSVAINTGLQITFDRNISAVAGKRLKIMDGAATLTDVDVSVQGTISNNVYSLPSAANLPNDKLIRVTIDAGAFVDATKQSDFAGITNEWSFTTILAPDTQKPVITFDNAQIPDPLEKNFATIAFGITVTDNRTVASATLRHRKTGEKDFATTALTLNNANGKWEGSIPNSFVSDMGFEYFFEAADNATPAANTARLPLDATTYFKSKTSFKNSPPSLTLPSAGTKNSWKIISIPYVFENGNNTAATLFSSLGTPDKTKWRLLAYVSNPESWNENIASIERGKGYFINTTISGASVSLSGAIAPPETRDNLFTMNLQAGWNQIGNPYTVTINLADVKNYNSGLANAQFVTYSNGSYTAVTQLAPFEGGFVNVPAATTIKVPFTGQTLSGGRRGSDDLGDDIDSEEWRVKINLSQGASTFDLGFIGMALDADPNLDAYDMVKPPRFFDFIDMSVAHPEHVSKKFSGDVVPTAPAHTWDFNVDSNLEGMAEMTWDQQKLQDARRELFLLDVARQVLVDMKKVGSYAFNPKESSSFRLYFGENLKIAPERILLGKAFPNPTAGVTTIGFSLPESGGRDQSVSLDVIDQMGRTLGTIVRGRFNPGFNEASFEAKSLPNGFYTYRLTVQNSQGRQVLVNKLIIK